MSLSHILCALSCNAASVGLVSLPSEGLTCTMPFHMATPVQKEACVASGAALLVTATFLLVSFYALVAVLDWVFAQIMCVLSSFGGRNGKCESLDNPGRQSTDKTRLRAGKAEQETSALNANKTDSVTTARRWLIQSIDVDSIALSSIRMILDIRRRLLPAEERTNKATGTVLDRLEAILESPSEEEMKEKQIAFAQSLEENKRTALAAIDEMDNTALMGVLHQFAKTVVELDAKNTAKKEKLDSIAETLGYGNDTDDFERVSWGTESVMN